VRSVGGTVTIRNGQSITNPEIFFGIGRLIQTIQSGNTIQLLEWFQLIHWQTLGINAILIVFIFVQSLLVLLNPWSKNLIN